MDRILAGLDFIFVYLDDLIIGSHYLKEHLQHLWVLFQRLQVVGLVINQEKCVFGVEEVEFLGHHMNTTGVVPIASRPAAILEQQQPTISVKELQGFLGVINFYRRFVPAAARILKPLTDQLKGNPKPACCPLLDRRDAGGLCGGQGGSGWKCPAHLPYSWSRDIFA
jgi:hypothetical protein